MPLRSSTSEAETYYTVLGISQDATKREIREAYKRLAILHHPDKNMGDFANACATFQKLQAAFSVLSDPFDRAEYDENLEVQAPVSDLDTQAPESPRQDFSGGERSAPDSPRPDSSDVKSSGATYPRSGATTVDYDDSDDGYDDDDDYRQQADKDKTGMGWRTEASLDEAIRESMLKVGDFIKELKVMAEEDYNTHEWIELKVKLNGEMRFLDGLRKDLSDLQATARG